VVSSPEINRYFPVWIGMVNMRNLGLSLIVVTAAFLAGCGSVSKSPTTTVAAGNLTITTTSLANGTVGIAYSSPITASGGATPYTYGASSLPSGLAINGSTGAITGTPAQSSIGTGSAAIKVTDSTTPSAQSATSNLSITISPAPLAVTTTSLPGGVAGSPYPSTTLQAAGGVPP
jgi:hypothetical protein